MESSIAVSRADDFPISEEGQVELKTLIQRNVDSAEGFRIAADITERQSFKNLFAAIARERRNFASALRSMCKRNCKHIRFEDLPTKSSLSASIHRWWLQLRSGMSSDELYATLAEAERGEDAMKAAYEEAMEKELHPKLKELLSEQWEHVKRHHDQIRDLRDAQRVN
jgi:uncharacterized protein (TIGR02284 family)